jgi:alkanesulfonate monooxygenase SsuD/methylene tetrahydromethanopterin reductase-like flavin-dependent oxidoreductase (luciferase family)
MKFALYLPNYGNEVSVLSLAELAGEAEQAGWDGFFLWDHLLVSRTQKLNIVDPWVALTAIAMRTTRLCFGTTVTPLSRRRPWVLARQSASLDQLSGGRLILSVGLGEPPEIDFAAFGEPSDARTRAEKLDEGLEILKGLWSGKRFSFQGRYYHVEKVAFRPTPFQSPRIPVWVGGWWPNPAPFRRAARWDGVLPLSKDGGFFVGPQELVELMAFIHQRRASTAPFDAAIIGTRPGLGKKPAAVKKSLEALAAAGATWWLQAMWREHNSVEALRAAIRQGPP